MAGKGPVKPIGRKAVMDAVVESAIALFSTRTFRDVTMVELGRHAGVNPGLIHLYFGSKEDVLHEAVSDCMDRLHSEISRYRTEDRGTGILLAAISRCRPYVQLLLTAAVTPLERPLALRLDDIPSRLAESLDLGEEGSLPGLSGEDIALGLLVMGIGFLFLERARMRTEGGAEIFPASQLGRLWEDVYPRWLDAILPGGS